MSQTIRAGLTLADPELFRTRAYIDGGWVDADAGETFEVVNPATGEPSPRPAAARTRRGARSRRRTARGRWRAKTAKERSAILRKWHDLMLANVDDLALILTTEQGKPLAEREGEVANGAAYVEWFAEEAKRVYGDVIPTIGNDRASSSSRSRSASAPRSRRGISRAR